jgi:hypothetical protein
MSGCQEMIYPGSVYKFVYVIEGGCFWYLQVEHRNINQWKMCLYLALGETLHMFHVMA